MSKDTAPTSRELEILKILWELREGTVRQVYEVMRERVPIVQNTVQAFLRMMETKGLVTHRRDGRTFVYHPVSPRDQTSRRMAGRLLEHVFDGAMDQLVDSLFSFRQPSEMELERLVQLVAEAKSNARRDGSN
jgi:predicted transcriptional regulator